MPGFTLRFLPGVRDQIRNAVARTRRDYGAAKAGEYSQLIRQALHQLRENPYVRQLRPDARLMHIRRPGQDAVHLFLYRVRDQVVEIGRFRYDAMDLEAQVPSEWKRQ